MFADTTLQVILVTGLRKVSGSRLQYHAAASAVFAPNESENVVLPLALEVLICLYTRRRILIFTVPLRFGKNGIEIFTISHSSVAWKLHQGGGGGKM